MTGRRAVIMVRRREKIRLSSVAERDPEASSFSSTSGAHERIICAVGETAGDKNSGVKV